MTPLTPPEVLLTIHKLPSLPAVVLELLASMEQEDVDVETLGQKVAHDQALTAKSLRLANSSFYGMVQQVTTPQQAISILGFRTIRCLVTTSALIGTAPHSTHADFDAHAFWRHAIAAAACAREVASNLGGNTEYAYTAALLHDIGRLIVVTQFPRHFDAVTAHQAQYLCTTLEAEQAVLGLDHAAVGHLLTQHWKFPPALQQAVACHHAQPNPREDVLTTAVRMANVLAHALEETLDDGGAALSPDVLAIGAELGLEASPWIAAVGRIKKSFAGASLVLSTQGSEQRV